MQRTGSSQEKSRIEGREIRLIQGVSRGKKGLSLHAVLRKSPQFLVTQGQEVKHRIIIMKTICLYHLMLPEIPGSESKAENPSRRAADWK